MSQVDLENIDTNELIRELRRESVRVSPKKRASIKDENENDIIQVNHNFSQIISYLISKIGRPFRKDARRRRCATMRLCWHNFLMHWKSIIVVSVPLFLLPLLVLSSSKEARCAFVVLLMAFYWMTEVLPLPVTSLIPIALFPLFGVMSTDEVCAQYFKEVNMMLFGGLSMAIAIEYCNLHERIALKVLLFIGTSPKLLMLGFMIITMFLSMWISNTAATAMTAPIVSAVLKEIQQQEDAEDLQEIQGEDTANEQLELPQIEEEKGEITEGEDVETGIDDGKTQEESIIKDEDVGVTEERKRQKSVADTMNEKLTTGYFLSLSFSSNIGGTGTLIGTGTNLIFAGIFERNPTVSLQIFYMLDVMDESLFPEATPINFAAWMAITVPSMLLNTFLGWIWLQIYFLRLFRGGIDTGGPEAEKKIRVLIQNKYDKLGSMTQHEISVLLLFILLVIFWLSRSPQFITGWGELVSDKSVKDSTPAIFFLLLMFLLPADNRFASCTGKHEISPSLLTWTAIHKKLPWGLILLLGGGFSMAHGCSKSGLSKLIGENLTILKDLHSLLLAFVLAFLACCLTQVTSNTSSANIFLPVLAEMSKSIHVHPLKLMIPTTLACSYAFMLPVGTPPNAIVQAASNMNTSYMMKAGAVMSIISIIGGLLVFEMLGPLVFNLTEVPDWVK